MTWPALRRRIQQPTTIAAIGALCVVALVPAAQAAPPPVPTATAAFSGAGGSAVVAGTLFARAGAALTLTVDAPDDTVCVDVSGAVSGHQTSSTAKPTWTFSFTAGQGDGAQAVTVASTDSANKNGVCTGQSVNAQASFVLDNTAPVVSAALTPAANGAGWNNADVQLAWSAADAGSGVASGPTPASDSQSASTTATGTTKTATATDRVGNVGSGSTTIKLDKGAPTIGVTRSPAANSYGWNDSDVTVSLTCADALSGVKSCSGDGTVVVSTEGADQSVQGQVVDNADNTATGGVTGISIDKTDPTLTGVATTEPVNGWYRDDVTIRWTASDGLSGVATEAVPADSVISGEGADLTTSAQVSDRAGNTTTATSAPVSIDRTPPTTTLTGAPATEWTNGAVQLGLQAQDLRSGVDSTTFSVDGGPAQSGTTIGLTSDGDHTVTFASTDRAGNVEATQTVHVRIDTAAPTISHRFAPEDYVNGSWTNAASVTVSFTCTDGESGVASCSGPSSVEDEGETTVLGEVRDGAGNTATDTATVRIDRTAPTVSASTTTEANSAGWYRTPVPVLFTCADAASGVATCPTSVTLGEGAIQSADGTATDVAGNSATGSFGPVKIDLTAPELHADVTSGWHTGDVTVDWSCTDELSGPAGQPDDDVVDGEGADLSSSAACTDAAGNAASTTISGIQIDRTPPATSVSVPEPLESGWYAGPARVTLSPTDAISGVAHTYYAVDGGDAQQYDGPFDFATKGVHTLTFWSADVAGNVEGATANTVTLKIDGQAPTTTVINPISPDSGWYVVSGIPVAFSAQDAESGVLATYYRIDDGEVQTYGQAFTASLGDGDHTIEYWSVDNAGNGETHRSVTVSVDTAAPGITASVIGGTLGDNGWYTSAVTVGFTCTDGGSGVATCPSPVTLTDSGAAQVVSGTVVDRAGNSSSTSLSVDIDLSGPTIDGVNVAGKRYVLGEAVPTPTCTASDDLSGTASCEVAVTGGNANGVGTFTWSATAEDEAGNTTRSAGTYKVVYRFDGFLQPINDTAHQIGLTTSVFKAGSTVPAKLQVKRSDGTVVQPVTAPRWLSPVRGSATTMPVDETVYAAVADSGSAYRYDSAGQQWQYNWKSLTAGYYWRVGVTLDDGETYYVNLALR